MATGDGAFDVIIIGGGPAGSTTAALLRKYAAARVLVLERERFPREHVGESQLPPIGAILHEMGCWEDVERAEFPIKVGVTFRWGREPDLWDFDFLPHGKLEPEPRPAPFAGQRMKTALQVERARYDDILLRHAETLGAVVWQETKVAAVHREGDRVTGVELADGRVLHARWYVDASGHAGILRRALDVAIDSPAKLQNIAAWNYWDNAEWADTIGTGGTRVQVLSLGYGWIWFIPIAPTRASVGLIVPVDYYKQSGLRFEQLYERALDEEPRVRGLLANAHVNGSVRTTKDWSFLAARAFGENWFLVGESVGFADPILSAGLTLAHTGARELAYSLAALLRGEHDEAWLKHYYEENQRARVWQHIRFADFWYAANGQLADLQEQCQRIAAESGLTLTAAEAWAWIVQGGFASDILGQAVVGGYDLASAKQVTQRFFGEKAGWAASNANVLRLALEGARAVKVPYYREGKVVPIHAFERDGKRLLMVGVIGLVTQLVTKHAHAVELMAALRRELEQRVGKQHAAFAVYSAVQALELLLNEGWIEGTFDPSRSSLTLDTPDEGEIVHAHREIRTGKTTSGSPDDATPSDAT